MSRSRFVAALIAIAVAARSLSLTFLHPLNWDEIEFFRATDWVRTGLVPYRDFWEHHTPLQWFFFAPITALARWPGVNTIIMMRWAQVPLWIVTFWLLAVWMRRAGLSLTARVAAILLALCSTTFMLPAVEYRIDTLGCAFYVLGIVLLQVAEDNGWMAFAGGAALCLAGLANIRLGPLLALTVLLVRIVRQRERAWGGTSALNGMFAGVIATLALGALYFFATHSAGIAFRRVWTDNYLADRLSPGMNWILVHRLVSPFGLRLLDEAPQYDPRLFELPTVIILIVGAFSTIRILIARRRAPDYFFVLAFLQVSSFLFVAAMKYIYTYHFEIVILLMLPFVATEVDRLSTTQGGWRIVVVTLLLASAVNIYAAVFRGKEADLGYQDLIMRGVESSTPVGSSVFDGVGWALHRRPAYRYWFLPKLVETLEWRKFFETYSTQQMAADPPAAIVSDHRIFTWFYKHPQLAAFATAHYLPVWRNLWLPGMSARLTPASPTAMWIVPADGAYRIYASNVLSIHPWFSSPLIFGTFESLHTEIALTGFAPPNRLPLQWTLDGVPIRPTDVLHLRRKQQLRATSLATGPLGVMIVPVGVNSLFRQPPHTVTLDAGATPVTHVPFR